MHDRKLIRIGNRTYDIRGVSADDKYFLNLSDGFNADFANIFTSFVEEDYVCFDIGANIGLTALMLAQYASAGKVYAIEAAPTVSKRLRENVANNHQRNISVISCAVGDTDGTIRFRENSAWGHVSTEGIEVPVKRLSTIVSELGLKRLDFIKIDVEGFEIPILHDSVDIINKFRSLVLLEFNSWCIIAMQKVSPLDFAEWILKTFQYVFILRRELPDRALHRIPPNQARSLLHTNLTRHGVVSDLIVTNAPERITCSKLTLEHGLRTSVTHQESITDERDQALAERDKAIASANALLMSTSWRITKPLRAISDALRSLAVRLRTGSRLYVKLQRSNRAIEKLKKARHS